MNYFDINSVEKIQLSINLLRYFVMIFNVIQSIHARKNITLQREILDPASPCSYIIFGKVEVECDFILGEDMRNNLS